MIIDLKRKYLKHCTVGELYIGGIFECYTLEDIRNEVKIPGKTCIPEGIYKVIINQSKRFNRQMPLLMDVPGFSGVRIHTGNWVTDTNGCILVGLKIDEERGFLSQSRNAYDNLFSRLLKKSLGGEPMEIHIYEKGGAYEKSL